MEMQENNEVLQAIMELSEQIKLNQKELSKQIKSTEERLTEKIEQVDAKLSVLSDNLLHTQAEVKILKNAK